VRTGAVIELLSPFVKAIEGKLRSLWLATGLDEASHLKNLPEPLTKIPVAKPTTPVVATVG
jgi:hypothetical protein